MGIKKQQQHLDYCVCLNTDVAYFIFVGQARLQVELFGVLEGLSSLARETFLTSIL